MTEERAKVNRFPWRLWAVLALAGAAAWSQPDVAGSDLWWHLASGRAIWSTGHIPCCDPFSFTRPQAEWMNHEWLWGALAWPAFALHPQLLWLLNLACALGAFALAYVRCAQLTGSAASSALAVWAGAATAHWFLDVRPHLTTLVAVQVLLLTRDRPCSAWLWPLLVAIWTNLHAGFVFGLGVIGLATALDLGRGASGRRRGADPGSGRASGRAERTGRADPGRRSPGGGGPLSPRGRWLRAAGCAGAILLNPWGLRILEYPLAYLPIGTPSPYRSLIEWAPPGLGWEDLDLRGWLWLGTFQARFWGLTLLAALGATCQLRRRSRGAVDPLLLALAAVTCVMALVARRFIPLFALVSLPLVALSIQSLSDRAALWVREGWPAGARAPARLLAAHGCWIVATAAVLGLWSGARLLPDPLGRWIQRDLYPAAALGPLSQMSGPLRVLNEYSWGGYLLLHLPRVRVFMDGRANTIYDDALFHELQSLREGADSAQAVIDRYRPDVALVPDGELARTLQALPRPWRVAYRDPVALLLVPPSSSWAPTPSAASPSAPGRAQALQQAGRESLLRGQPGRAETRLRAAIHADPLLVGAHGDLATLRALASDREGMARVLADARERFPRRAAALDVLEGRLRLRLGERRRAARLLRRGLPRGPFEDPRRIAGELRGLEGHRAESASGVPTEASND